MLNADQLHEKILSGGLDHVLGPLYGEDTAARRGRYVKLIDTFQKTFGQREVMLFSVPGRAEITGNHTDHNRGAVLAAAVNLDIIAIAAKREDGIINLHSENFPPDRVELSELSALDSEKGNSQALIRGIAARLSALGHSVGGFDCVTTSDVIKGSGLSSSAAFSVMVATIFSHLYNGGTVEPLTCAIVSSYAENNYFDKPSGLMDQTACALGGFLMIDFEDPSAPKVEKIDFGFASTDHSLCAVDTGSAHNDLTHEYALMPAEMREVAAVFGRQNLREVDEAEFMKNISLVRDRAGDRAVLRAMHFFSEHKRVLLQRKALKSGDFGLFLDTVNRSGRSSFMYLQNVFVPADKTFQPLALALAMSDEFLAGRGAFRVHGGGFAGIIMAFVPNKLVEDYIAFMEPVFGEGRVKQLTLREVGAIRLA